MWRYIRTPYILHENECDWSFGYFRLNKIYQKTSKYYREDERDVTSGNLILFSSARPMGDHGNKRMRVMGCTVFRLASFIQVLCKQQFENVCVREKLRDICIMWSTAAAFPEGTTTSSPLFYSKENASLSVLLDTCLFPMENTVLQEKSC